MAWFRSSPKPQVAAPTPPPQPDPVPAPAASPAPLLQQPPSALQDYVDSIGAYAKQPTSAYALSGIYAVISPFSFPASQGYSAPPTASGTVAASPASTAALPPNPPFRAASSSPRAAPTAAALRSLPPFWQLAGLSAIFAGGGYMIQEGDALNGSGTVTAWSLTYLCFNTLATFRIPSLPRLILTASTVSLGAAVHGSYYFSRTTWRGAIPGLVTTSSTASTPINARP